MDGLKSRLNESVQLKLSVMLCLAILIVAIVAGVFSFVSALDESHELQDDMLRQIAHLMERQRLCLLLLCQRLVTLLRTKSLVSLFNILVIPPTKRK
jgi:hypothetical protein